MGPAAKSSYDPSLLGKVWILLTEQIYGAWLVITGVIPFLIDIFWTNVVQGKETRLPDNIGGLLDPKLFSNLSGRKVESVEYSERLEQHANSTDRAWFKVRFEGEDTDTFIFAKCHAKTFLIRAMMSIFDVYRNELHAYAAIKMPVRTPGVHIAKWTRSRFCLAMDDLRKEDVTFPSIFDTVVDKQLAEKVLVTLAKIHAKYWQNVPAGIWTDETRPYQGKGACMYTLWNIRRRCPGLIPDDIAAAFSTALWHWDTVRAYLSKTANTMVHGDSHMGNFFITRDGEIGTFDFQVLSLEHCMRDVSYFLSCSYPEDKVGGVEKDLIKYYLAQLEANGVPKSEVPSFDEAWLQYRVQGLYTMYAFVFSGGLSDLMDEHQSEYGISRIVAHWKRVDTAGSLYDILDGKI